MTGRGKPGRPQPSCARDMGGTLPQEEKDFIFPLLQAVLAKFESVRAFGEWTLSHHKRPRWTYEVKLENALYSRISGSPQYFPEWNVVTWVIDAVLEGADVDQIQRAKSLLAYQWHDLGKGRPRGYCGALPGEPALTHPSEAANDETELAVMREVHVPRLENDLVASKARTTLLEQELASIKGGRHRLRGADDLSDEAVLPATVVADLEAQVADLRAQLVDVRRSNATLQHHITDLESIMVAADQKVYELTLQLNQKRLERGELFSGVLDLATAAPHEQVNATVDTAVFAAVKVDQLPGTYQPDSTTAPSQPSEFAEHRRKRNTWTDPKQMAVDDAGVDTTLMSLGEISSLLASRPEKQHKAADYDPKVIQSVLDARGQGA